MATINARDGRTIYVGDSVIEDGTIVLDIHTASSGNRPYSYSASNVDLVELLAALSKILGVTATYEAPRELTVPERLAELGLGTVFTLAEHGYGGKYVKIGANRYAGEDTGNIFSASDFASWSDFQLLSKGMGK